MDIVRLLQPSDERSTNKKRSAEIEPAEIQEKKVRLDIPSLCEACEKVDFRAFFTSDPLKFQKFRAHSDALLRSPCPICKFVAGLLEHRLEKSLHEYSEEVEWSLKRTKMSGSEYLETRDICAVNRIAIRIRSPKRRFRSLERELEPSGELFSTTPGDSSARMIRTPLQACFDVSLLESWLKESGNRQRQLGKSYRATLKDALHQLLDQKRLRMLDVRTGEVVILQQLERYIALSYVWGKSMAHYAAAATHDYCSASVPSTNVTNVAWVVDPRALPATIRDAASVVEQLGKRFLWIDSLCISQADPKDKAAIISQMGAIYGMAYLTIVASSGDDANTGLHRLRRQNIEPEQGIEFMQRGNTVTLLPVPTTFERAIENTKWNSRGWTYQERLLSERCAFFTNREVFFAGPRMLRREAYRLKRATFPRGKPQIYSRPTGRRLAVGDTQAKKDDFNEWKSAAVEYTKMTLSHPGDRLDAFKGILDLVVYSHFKQEKEACCGLKPTDLARSLMWVHKPARNFEGRIRYNATSAHVLPSWSWAGWLGEVHFPFGLAFDSKVGIIDSHNIKLMPVSESASTGSSLSPWPFEPRSSNIELHGGIVLHLWMPILQCRLERTEDPRTFRIQLASRSKQNPPFGYIDVSDNYISGYTGYAVHDFIVFIENWANGTSLSYGQMVTDVSWEDLDRKHLAYQHIKLI